MKYSYLFIFIFSIVCIGCIPPTEEPITEVTLDVTNTEFQRVYDYQDAQQLDSLLLYTSHKDPSYRYLVANGLASIQDEAGLDSLYKLLYDPVIRVRTAAAYAIGQIGSSKSATELITAFKTKDTLDINNSYNATILEAVGKVAPASYLPYLATVATYRATDSLLLVGQSRAIYNYMLRGEMVTEGTDRMVQYLTEEGFPSKVKLIAANYLARSKGLDLDIYKNRIIQVLDESQDPQLRMALALAAGKTKGNDILESLMRIYDEEEDYRVKCNLIRAMSTFPYIKVIEPMLALVNDENLHIANTAADYLIRKGTSNDATIYRNYLNDSLHYSIQAKVYSATLKHMPVYYTNTKNLIKKDILNVIGESSNSYEIANYVAALGNDPFSYKDIFEISNETKSPIVKSACASAIASIIQSPNFIKAYKGGHRRVKGEMMETIKNEFEQGDVGSLAIYGELFANESAGLKEVITDTTFLLAARQKLSLPKEIETYNSLGNAIAYLTDTKIPNKTPDYNNAIKWSVFAQYGDSVQVAIKTTKGVIRVKMYANEAPGSVANFLRLSDDDFYNGKTIHRVVPNFVVQAGCPRGDGYGGLNYTIRSELPQLHYEDEGYIGMASAGLHTEGTQWFITHSPAMHLSGRYTIFGKVTEGMDVVHALNVGDKIEDMIITKG